jgi:rSAM/selenodomain-associated transferase 2
MELSAVIPCWREATVIGACVRAAAQLADEVIVADAKSPDGSAALARAAGARVAEAPRGRGHQLAAGARAANGDVLLFLHADARLPPHARDAIERALGDERTVGGNFRLRFEPDGTWSRVFAHANHLRRAYLRIYYGDSGLFVRRAAYDAIGGFQPLPIMEDYELVKRLERHGPTAYLDHVEIVASARRFQAAPLRTLAVWTLIQGLASSGVHPARLARLYANIR